MFFFMTQVANMEYGIFQLIYHKLHMTYKKYIILSCRIILANTSASHFVLPSFDLAA